MAVPGTELGWSPCPGTQNAECFCRFYDLLPLEMSASRKVLLCKAPCRPFVRFWLIKRPLRPLAGPSGHPPAPKRRKRARGRLSQKLWPSPGKIFREARRASPQRQNDRARASDGAGLPRLSRKLRPSPGKLFRDGQAPSAKITEASASDAPLPGCRGSFNRRRENFLGRCGCPALIKLQFCKPLIGST